MLGSVMVVEGCWTPSKKRIRIFGNVAAWGIGANILGSVIIVEGC